MIEVVGIGDAGWSSLAESARQHVRAARVVIGGTRHLEALPDDVSAERRAWPSPLRAGLGALLDETGLEGVVVLASGDPLRSGVATTLIDVLGAHDVRVHPTVSSDTLARARMGWSAESCDVVTTVGRCVRRVVPFLTPGARVVVLCSDGAGPAELARLVTEAGAGEAVLTAWWHLDGESEGSRRGTAAEWGETRTPDLVVVCVEMPKAPCAAPSGFGPAPGRPDDAFDHDGLITKRDVRAGALARLRPSPGALLWDLGAGSGAVGIEWCLAARDARAVAVEQRAERAERVAHNADLLGVAHLVRVDRSPIEDFLARSDEPSPDAVFLGGGITARALDAAVERLAPGGRIVAHAVTLQSELLLHAARARHGGTMTRIAVEALDPLGSFDGWKPARAVVSWFFEAPQPTSTRNENLA